MFRALFSSIRSTAAPSVGSAASAIVQGARQAAQQLQESVERARGVQSRIVQSLRSQLERLEQTVRQGIAPLEPAPRQEAREARAPAPYSAIHGSEAAEGAYHRAIASPTVHVRKSGLRSLMFHVPERSPFGSWILARYKREHPNQRIVGIFRCEDGRVISMSEPGVLTYESDYQSGSEQKEIIDWQAQEIALEGSCDTHGGRCVTKNPGNIKCYLVKSKNNTCLCACFRYVTKCRKQVRTIEAEARCLSAGTNDPRGNDDIRALCAFFHLRARVFQLGEGGLNAPDVFGNSSHQAIDLLLHRGHFYLIESGAPAGAPDSASDGTPDSASDGAPRAQVEIALQPVRNDEDAGALCARAPLFETPKHRSMTSRGSLPNQIATG